MHWADLRDRATPAGTSSLWRPDIQGLRALAVVLVIAYHAGLPLPGGFIGVDVFFVISGFLITSLLVRGHANQGSLRLGRFWAARVRRILPALSVVVITVLVLSALLEDPSGAQQQTVKTAVATMLMVSNVFLERSGFEYFTDPAYVNPLLNMWSLAVEEQFYVVFPLLLVLFLTVPAFRGRLGTAGLLLAVCAISSFVWAVAMSFGLVSVPLVSDPQNFAFYSVTTRAWEFAVGAALAAWALGPASLSRRIRETLGWLGLLAIGMTATLLTPGTPFPGLVAVLPVAGSAAMIAAGTGGTWSGTDLLGSRPMTFVGDRSYSLYLWHWPLIVFAELVFGSSWLVMGATLLLTFAASMASFRWVEQPFRSGSASIRTRTAGAAALALCALALALGSAQAVKFGWGQSWALGAHAAIQRDCDSPPLDAERCRWSPTDPRGTVLLVGDSQAWAVGDAVVASASTLGFATVISAHNNCPFTAGLLEQEQGCAAWQDQVGDYIKQARPTAVIIANAPYGGRITPALADQTMTAVQGLGSTPIWLLNPPGAGDNVRKSLLLAPAPTRSEPRPPGQFSQEELSALHLRWGSLSILDPFEALCSSSSCQVARDGVEYYTDGNHLSVDGASLLITQIVRALQLTEEA